MLGKQLGIWADVDCCPKRPYKNKQSKYLDDPTDVIS